MPIHADDLAVDRFAAAMKEKLAKKRKQGYGGWETPDDCHILRLHGLLDYEAKRENRDPIDIANYAMMIWNRKESR